MASMMIMTYTNWSIIFIFTTKFFSANKKLSFKPTLIIYIMSMVVTYYLGDWSSRSTLEIIFGSSLTIPVVIIGTSLNVIPVYIARSLERIIIAPEHYQGPTHLPNFKADYARFKAESLVQDESKPLLKEDQ